MKIAKTVPDALKILWKEKVLFKPMSKEQIVQEMEKRGYNFDSDAIRMALERADFITKKGKGSSRLFVQKYPFVEEEAREK